MTAQESPTEANRGAQDLAEGSDVPSVGANHDNTAEPAKAKIGAAVEKALDATVWDLVNGRIGLQDVTASIAALYSIGYADGIASCRARIARLEHEADVLYVQAFNPADRAKLIRQRMDAGEESFWADFVANGGDAQ